jgi:hypothetical protein
MRVRPGRPALTAREFSDVIVFRSPLAAVQRALFGICELALATPSDESTPL